MLAADSPATKPRASAFPSCSGFISVIFDGLVLFIFIPVCRLPAGNPGSHMTGFETRSTCRGYWYCSRWTYRSDDGIYRRHLQGFLRHPQAHHILPGIGWFDYHPRLASLAGLIAKTFDIHDPKHSPFGGLPLDTGATAEKNRTMQAGCPEQPAVKRIRTAASGRDRRGILKGRTGIANGGLHPQIDALAGQIAEEHRLLHKLFSGLEAEQRKRTEGWAGCWSNISERKNVFYLLEQ